MQNLPQGSEVWIIAGIAFVLGFIVEWLIARSRKNALVHEYERQLQSSQRDLKRTQDDLDTVQSQLEAQRDRAEVLAAERANAQSELLLVEGAQSDREAKVYDLEAAIGNEIERREVAEELLEQTRIQARELQNSLDAARSELHQMETRLGEESEARGAAETALAAEALRVSELAQRLETLGAELAAAQSEMAAAVASQQSFRDAETVLSNQDAPREATVEPDTDDEAQSEDEVQIEVISDESPDDESSEGSQETEVQPETQQNAALEAARARVTELSESVSSLSATGAELAVELEKRERANQLLRAQLAALGAEPDLTLDRLVDPAEPQAGLESDVSDESEPQLPSLAAHEEPPEQLVQDAADAEKYQRMEEDLVEKAARVGELEGQLAEQAVAIDGLKSDLTEAQSQVQNLSSQVDHLRGEYEVLRIQNGEMENRLQNRTEEVSALTSAAVAAAATIQRRDEALRQAAATEQSLREQLAASSETQQEVEDALNDNEGIIAEQRSAIEELESELSALMADRDAAEATLAEKEAALASALASAPAQPEERSMPAQESIPDAETRQAPAASPAEQEAGRDAKERPATSVATDHARTSIKASAIRKSLSVGVTPRELSQPQDLEQLPGIGPMYKRKLYAAGIGTFWEFASCTDNELMEALGLDGTDQQRARATEARVEAYKLAEETDSIGTLWQEGLSGAA